MAILKKETIEASLHTKVMNNEIRRFLYQRPPSQCPEQNEEHRLEPERLGSMSLTGDLGMVITPIQQNH